LSSEIPVGTAILGRGRTSTSLKLPTSPSAAFSDFTNPFIKKSQKQRGLIEPIELKSTIRDLGINSFRTTDFRESPRGDFAKAAFNIKVKKTFGPQNLPRNRRKNFIGFEF
jgi:hypothetical protein